MKRDHRPYILKRLDIKFQQWYAQRFLRPQFEYLGKKTLFLKPWYIEIFGWPIALGDCANVIATPDKRVRLTVWSNWEEKGSIKIGNYALICPGVRISSASSIVIGESCMIAQGVHITDSDWHDVYDRSISIGQSAAINIGNNVWIGDSVFICKGVTIGDNSIIGTGAVVVKDIPADVIAAGNPATVVKRLDIDRPVRTRGDWYTETENLIKQFDEIDRELLKGNTFLGWLRSLFFPKKGD